jgi:hypothetical protein
VKNPTYKKERMSYLNVDVRKKCQEKVGVKSMRWHWRKLHGKEPHLLRNIVEFHAKG